MTDRIDKALFPGLRHDLEQFEYENAADARDRARAAAAEAAWPVNGFDDSKPRRQWIDSGEHDPYRPSSAELWAHPEAGW